MMEEALHIPFLPSLDGGSHRKRLFTNESEIMDIVNGMTDFDSILLNDMLDAEEEGSDDGFSWNEFQDIASDLLLDGSNDDNWDFTANASIFDETVLNDLAGDTWLPSSFDDPFPVSHVKAISSVQAPVPKPEVPKQRVETPKPSVHLETAPIVKRLEPKPKPVLPKKSSLPTMPTPVSAPMHVPRVVTSAELKILGSRSKQRSNSLMRFQTEEPNIRIVERSSKTAVVVKKKSVFRGGQSLLKMSYLAGGSMVSLSSPDSPAKTLSPSPMKQASPLYGQRNNGTKSLLKPTGMQLSGLSAGSTRYSKPFIEVDHDYCSFQPAAEEAEAPVMLELMDLESFQHEVVIGEEVEVHDRLPSYYTAVTTSPCTEMAPPISVETSRPSPTKKKQAVALPIQLPKPKLEKPSPVAIAEKSVESITVPDVKVAKPQKAVTPTEIVSKTPEKRCRTPVTEKPSLVSQNSTEKRPKTLLMPPKYQQVSYCEKILQIENDSEDELVDIEGVDESDTFDRLPSYVTSSKTISPRKSRENKYIDKDEEYTPRKERLRGRKKKDRMNKSTSPAKMKRKVEAVEQVKVEKQKKRGRPPKSIEPERKKVKTKDKSRKKQAGKQCNLSESESSDDEGLARLSKPGAFKAIYSDSENEENNNNGDEEGVGDPLKDEDDKRASPVVNDEFYSSASLSETDDLKLEGEESSRIRTISWKSNHSYEDLSGTYQNELGFTIFGDFNSVFINGTTQMRVEDIAQIPDSFPMDEIEVKNHVAKDDHFLNEECDQKNDCGGSDNHNEFIMEGDIKQEASVEFEIELTGLDGECVSGVDGVDFEGVMNPHDGEQPRYEDEQCDGMEEDQGEEDAKPIQLRILGAQSENEHDESKLDSPKKQRRKLTLSDYLIRKEYEKNICSSTSGVASPDSRDVEEGEIEGDLNMTEANLEEAAKQLSALPQEKKRRESEKSDFYKKVKEHKRKREKSCSSSSSSASEDSDSSDSSSASDDLQSRNPSPFLKARRKSRTTSLRYSSSRSRRRGSYSTDSTSSESSDSGRSRSRSTSSSHERRRKRRSYSSCSDCSASSYDVKSKSRRKERSKSRPVKSEQRRVIHVVGQLQFMDKKVLLRKFKKFGPIEDINIKEKTDGSQYAFITFYHSRDALDAMEHGNDDTTKPKFEISFGGRRTFCRENYADLDGRTDSRYAAKPVDFDALLRETKEKLTKRC